MAFKPAVFTSTSGPQLRLAYDPTNYTNFATGSGGDLTIAPTGGDTAITGKLAVSADVTVGARLTIRTTSPSQNFEFHSDGTMIRLYDATNSVAVWTYTISGSVLTLNRSTTVAGKLTVSSNQGLELTHASGPVKIASLAGTGTRAVVVDANGVMSAP